MSLARFKASILWSSDLSGAALEVWTGACIGGEYNRRLRKGRGRIPEIHLDLLEVEIKSREFRPVAAFRRAAPVTPPPNRSAASRAADPRPPQGPGSSPSRRRRRSLRREIISAASRPLEIPPMPTTGIETAAATSRTWSSATGLTAAPERPPLPAPSQGPPPAGSTRRRPQRVDQ